MKIINVIAFCLSLAGLASCQSVPAERKNNCACNWENFAPLPEGVVA